MAYVPRTKADQRWLAEGGFYDESEPLKVKKFVETFGMMPDKPDTNLSILDWVWEDVVCPLYGEKTPVCNECDKPRCHCPNRTERITNRYHYGSVFVMKKQTKSASIALLSLFDFLSHAGSEVYIWSVNIESCQSIWKYASFIAENSSLSKHIKCNHNLKTIRWKQKSKAGMLKLMSGTKIGKRGQNATSVYIDELSEIQPYQQDAWDGLLLSGTATFDHWKMVAITTPQYSRQSLVWKEWQKNQAILKNEDDDPTYLAVCHSVPDEFADTPENWWEYIPALGTTVSKNYYLTQYEKAKQCPRDLAVFKCENLCQWVTVADQWIPDEIIDMAAIKLDESTLYGKDCWIGIDAALYSLSAYVIIVEKGDKLILLPRFQMPIETAELSDKKYGTSFMAWGKAGYLSLTHGNQFDPAFIRSQIVEDSKRFRIVDAASDGYNFAESATILQTDHGITVHDLPPTVRSLSEATVEFERRISKGEMLYIDNPCMRHCLRNVQVKEYQDGILIDRDKSTGRYDGVSAGIHALNRYLNKPAYKYAGIYTLDA